MTNIVLPKHFTYGDLTLHEIGNYAEKVSGEWNGDEDGKLQEESDIAIEIVKHVSEIIDLIHELEGEL
jgi:hypothetical protein